MRTFHDILADIDRELAAADLIPTDEPAAVAAFLLARDARPLTTATGDTADVVPAAAIRRELDHLTQYGQP